MEEVSNQYIIHVFMFLVELQKVPFRREQKEKSTICWRYYLIFVRDVGEGEQN